MGADQFSYTVEYDEDANAALQKLRQSVFDSGKFNGSENEYGAIDEILMDFELMEAGGTGTIIDVTRVGDSPDIGTAVSLSSEELNQVFGTTTPSVSDLEQGSEFFGEIERGHCRYLTLYDDDNKPTHIHFSGYSSD